MKRKFAPDDEQESGQPLNNMSSSSKPPHIWGGLVLPLLRICSFNTDMEASSLGVEMVDIYVGPSSRHFHLHKTVLCSKVPYFHKMFNSEFIEAHEGKTTLPEEDEDAFILFVEWVYSGHFTAFDITHHVPDGGPFLARILLYGFAEKICLSPLMDYTITSLKSNYHHYKRSPSQTAMKRAYQCTGPGSLLRKFMAMNLHHQIVAAAPMNWPTIQLYGVMMECSELGIDTLNLMRQTLSKEMKSLKSLSVCLFHVHADEERCDLKEIL